MAEYRITKIKISKGKWCLAWEIYNPDTCNWDGYSLASKDKARKEFVDRMKVMANHVVEICEFPDSAIKKIGISGVTINYKDDNKYLVITAAKLLEASKAPLILNTPPRPEVAEEDGDDSYTMSSELIDDLTALEEEAWRYINGDRAPKEA